MRIKLNSVLLVDDNEATNNFNKRLLSALDLTDNVQIALNGKEALDHIVSCKKDELPSLILLDINMPMMDGFQFLEAYKELEEKKKGSIVIMMLTTSIAEEDKNRAEKYGDVAGYLNEPLSPQGFQDIWDKHFSE